MYFRDREARSSAAKSWNNVLLTKEAELTQLAIDSTEVVSEPLYYNRIATGGSAEVVIKQQDTVSALYSLPKSVSVGVLNFASYKNPGGGFLKGSCAQEECLCMESNLFPALKSVQSEYYTPHREGCKNPLYGDDYIVTKECTFYKYQSTNKRNAVVITAAAPNASACKRHHNHQKVMSERMKKIYVEFALYGCEMIVLGAWGCGVFGNDAEFVASNWKVLTQQYHGLYKMIYFAVPDQEKFKIFNRVFEK